jgi:hypothetical protein
MIKSALSNNIQKEEARILEQLTQNDGRKQYLMKLENALNMAIENQERQRKLDEERLESEFQERK